MTGERTYLGWFDPDAKRPLADRARDAAARFRAKHGTEPAELLVNAADAPALAGAEGLPAVVGRPVPRNTFYAGPVPARDDVAAEVAPASEGQLALFGSGR